MVRGNDPIRRLDDLVRVQERLLGLYRGPFLDGLADAPWAIPVRRKTASDLVRCLGDLGRYWERGSQAEHAARCRVAAAAVGDGLRQLVNDR